MKEIKIAAEEETNEVASIATPAPEVAYCIVSDISIIFERAFESIYSGNSCSITFVIRTFAFLSVRSISENT